MNLSDKNIITLKDIEVKFDDDIILNGINLSIKDKEFVTLLGPSGCGKTTTLRIIGGFLYPNKGTVHFDGEDITEKPPYLRPLNTVFQRYALFPHLNVYDNIAFGLKIKKFSKDEIYSRISHILGIVNLKGFEKRRVTQLSGGQQQRVAIARALVNRPKVLLLDEPLGALDLKLRKEMQIELKNIQQKLETTFVYVTHDQEEALTMSDTIVVMNEGEILQTGTPVDIYNEPKNAFVADFIGESNIVNGVMHHDYLVEFAGNLYGCEDAGFRRMQPVDVIIRPEDIKLVSPDNAMLKGLVDSVVFKGVHYEITVSAAGLYWVIHSIKQARVGERVGLRIGPGDMHIMTKMFEGSTNIIKGEIIDEHSIKFIDVTFTRENHGFDIGKEVTLTIDPKDIELVSPDRADTIVYLETLIYKGAHNEAILYTEECNILAHTQLDEELGTDVGIKFNFDKIGIK